MNRRILSCLMLILLSIPSRGLAQGASTTSGDWTTVRATSVGEKLTVELKSGKRENGKLIRTSDTGLTLKSGKKEMDISRDDVRRVHREAGKSAMKATLIGTAVGAGGGAALGAATGGCNSQQICIIGRGEAAGIGAVAGGAFGAIGGFLFGKLKSKRTLIYEAGV